MRNLPGIFTHRLIIFSLVLMATITGCTLGQAAPTPTATPSPKQILTDAANAMLAVETVQFDLTRSGEPIVIEPSMGMIFISANGAYQQPDQLVAISDVDFNGTVIQIELYWLPEGRFISNPLTGQLMAMPPTLGLNPMAIFKAETGIYYILKAGIQNPEDLGIETIDEQETRHIRGKAKAQIFESIIPISAGLAKDELVQMDVWLESTTLRLIRAQVTEPSGEVTTLDLWGHNEPVMDIMK